MITDDEMGAEIEIHNVVTKATFGQRFDLDEIAASLPNVEIDPDKYTGIIYRPDDPKATVFIYSSGIMVTVSAKSEHDSIRAIQDTITKLNSLGVGVHPDPKLEVCNIFAKTTLPWNINIELAAMTLENTIYEPEQTPGLIYKPNENMGIIIHHTGSLIIAGGTTEDEIELAVKNTVKRLSELELLDDC